MPSTNWYWLRLYSGTQNKSYVPEDIEKIRNFGNDLDGERQSGEVHVILDLTMDH